MMCQTPQVVIDELSIIHVNSSHIMLAITTVTVTVWRVVSLVQSIFISRLPSSPLFCSAPSLGLYLHLNFNSFHTSQLPCPLLSFHPYPNPYPYQLYHHLRHLRDAIVSRWEEKRIGEERGGRWSLRVGETEREREDFSQCCVI